MNKGPLIKYLIVYFVSTTVKIVGLNAADCKYIKSVKVYVNFALFLPFVQLKNSYEKTIEGCLTDSKFLSPPTVKIGINCTGDEITMLKENSVKNMNELKSVYIISCPVEKIEPNAFTNVTKLEMITIMYGSVKEILRGTFDIIPTLTQIVLRGHQIDYVADYAFGALPNLKLIDLTYNKLHYLSTNWFTNSTRLLQIYLSHNSITTIRKGTFQYVPNLQYLWISHNKISTIDAGAFNGLSELLYLDLGHNYLTTISLSIFPSDLLVSHVSLEKNLINYLSIGFLNRVISKMNGGSINIAGNPLKCPCLDLIHRWMFEEKIESRLLVWSYSKVKKTCFKPSTPVCGVAKNASRDCTSSVDSELSDRYVKAVGKYLTMDCI